MTPEERLDAACKELRLRIEHVWSECQKRPFGLFLAPTADGIAATAREVFTEAIAQARAEAIEECARVVECFDNDVWPDTIAAAIRSLHGDGG